MLPGPKQKSHHKSKVQLVPQVQAGAPQLVLEAAVM
mgnify:CR=1 FL=1